MANTTHISAHWQRTKHIVADALELPHSQRRAFVTQACASDAVLHAEVLDLLRSFDTAGDVLSEQGVPARMLADALAAPIIARGTQIGRYEVHSLLGSGGMGSVFEAFDTVLQRPVALKLLSMGLASTGARRRFDAEAAALARLDHPGVARVFEIGVYQPAEAGAVGNALSVPFFAMELVQGSRTIEKFTRETHASVRDVLALFARVCDAIHHGHQKSVLHRDIKPRNILVDAQGNPKVIDFGVSRLLDAGSAGNVTQANDIVGTPAYMPPEAFEKGIHALDTRADVYSLGITLYELLLGEPVFEVAGLSPSEASRFVLARSAPLLGARRADCKGDVETIIAKAMSRDPADRYQSVDQLAADLRRVLSYEPVIARAAPLWKQGALFARRHKPLVFAACAVLCALGVGVAGLVAGISRARESERIAKEQANRATQISDFMINMIRSGSSFDTSYYTDSDAAELITSARLKPWPKAVAEGHAPSVGDLLFTSFNQLESSFPDDPGLRAELGAMLAQTSINLTDPRSAELAHRAERMLTDVHGEDHTRTVAVRAVRMHAQALAGEYAHVPDIERSIRLLIARKLPEEQSLLAQLCSTYATACRNYSRPESAIALLQEARAALDSTSPNDNQYKLSIESTMLQARTTQSNREQSIVQAKELFERAKSIPTRPELTSLSMLFYVMMFQRDNNQLEDARDTCMQGISQAVAFEDGGIFSTYEWYHNLFMISLMLGDHATAEYAAREQAAASLASLGPTSSYTTKAHGRLARVLLGANKDLADAQRAARAAMDGAPDLLAKGDWWTVYHELLWAWAIRAQGNPERARTIIRDRMTVEATESQNPQGDWGQVIRWTQLAECEIDIATRDPAHSLAEAEWCVDQAVCYAQYLGRDWPSSEFAYKAQDRLVAMQRARAK